MDLHLVRVGDRADHVQVLGLVRGAEEVSHRQGRSGAVPAHVPAGECGFTGECHPQVSEDGRSGAAQQQSSQATLNIDDLDNLATPESILMSAVFGEDTQDRSDRTILLPWVKFLWESYCQCLELLKLNSHCENLYHDIAKIAFAF